jgi:leucyl/phenylalanyl-tRNA--protein transferase|tara:strand:+ start:90 stop:824 length:735 start_codon:yes stop_codon:yes gene_type:complete
MTQVRWLDPTTLSFPPVDSALAEPNGLLAVGGDLSPERLQLAYRSGIFPWYEDDQPILWWSPDPRSVLFPDRLKISRSLRKTLRRNQFSVTFDAAFGEVLHLCAQKRPYSQGTWITREMEDAYNQLHLQGIAHSVESWSDGELVGGLYGLSMGSLFFGESMFSLKTDASKVALVYLVGQLQNWGFRLIDCQIQSDHLDTLGAEEISRVEFLAHIDAYIDKPAKNRDWTLRWCYNKPQSPDPQQP